MPSLDLFFQLHVFKNQIFATFEKKRIRNISNSCVFIFLWLFIKPYWINRKIGYCRRFTGISTKTFPKWRRHLDLEFSGDNVTWPCTIACNVCEARQRPILRISIKISDIVAIPNFTCFFSGSPKSSTKLSHHTLISIYF